MNKKKNTLQDLDDFLKQQAATLVNPDSLSNQIESQEQPKMAPLAPAREETSESIPEELKASALKEDPAFRKKLYDFIIRSLENQKDSLPEDKMLINTALYLKSGGDWKNVIRAYWKGR